MISPAVRNSWRNHANCVRLLDHCVSSSHTPLVSYHYHAPISSEIYLQQSAPLLHQHVPAVGVTLVTTCVARTNIEDGALNCKGLWYLQSPHQGLAIRSRKYWTFALVRDPACLSRPLFEARVWQQHKSSTHLPVLCRVAFAEQALSAGAQCPSCTFVHRGLHLISLSARHHGAERLKVFRAATQ
jgi:hypothetical protein